MYINYYKIFCETLCLSVFVANHAATKSQIHEVSLSQSIVPKVTKFVMNHILLNKSQIYVM